jgi:hypothetical protein
MLVEIERYDMQTIVASGARPMMQDWRQLQRAPRAPESRGFPLDKGGPWHAGELEDAPTGQQQRLDKRLSVALTGEPGTAQSEPFRWREL